MRTGASYKITSYIKDDAVDKIYNANSRRSQMYHMLNASCPFDSDYDGSAQKWFISRKFTLRRCQQGCK